MKSSVFILLLVILNTTLFAQAPDTLWTKTFGGNGWDYGYSVQQTDDEGYIITGYTGSFGAGSGDVWLIKTDANGDTLWTRTFGGSDNDGGNSVQQTSDGGYIITGYTRSFGSGDDIYLIKTDSIGHTLWTKNFGGSGFDRHGYSVQQTTDWGYIVAGIVRVFSLPNPSYNLLLIKTNADGDTLSTKTHQDSDVELGASVQQTTDDGYIVAGHSNKFLIKTDANGDTLWMKIYGGNNSLDMGYSVDQTSDGGYIVTGYSDDSDDGWLIKTDANGNTLWTKMLGENSDRQFSVQQTSDGGYIITGGKLGAGNSDVWLIKVAPDVTSINENPQAAFNDYRLHQNFPNPFNPTTNIEFSIPKSEFVTLKVYNILGEEVATLVSERLTAGSYKYDWPARSSGGDVGDLASGVYLYRMVAGDFVQTRKMILLK